MIIHPFAKKVKDREHIGNETVGWVDVPVEELLTGEEYRGPNGDGWYDVVVKERLHKKSLEGRVCFFVKFIPAAESHYFDEDDCYFPQTQNNKVTLYQDADTPALSVFKGVKAENGEGEYEPTRCWSDIYDAIAGAERLIYITGWSVYSGIHLVRDEDEETGRNKDVGTLLKEKAEQGVTVRVMTWNDRSNDGTLKDMLTKGGMMGTHDEETAEYFKDSKVIIANVARQKASWKGIAGQFSQTCYTHHQKTVIVDMDPLADSSSDKRRLVAFLGGLDITDGRYDTPEFPLFKTLGTFHKDDFYQNCTEEATVDTGPREPWHDIHAKLEGPAVRFVMKNFTERWIKQSDNPDDLMDLEEFDLDAHGQADLEDGWSVRILRSITQDSAQFDEDRVGILNQKYGCLVDDSIQKTYIKLIRSAKSFIYIENQYFLGSAYNWKYDDDKTTDTQHTIPMELTMRIIKSIEDGTSFKVYICIPMFPEGIPTSSASQEILYWQHCTMHSMYKMIAIALKKLGDEGVGKSPQDYLNFFCLGKRETLEEVPEDLNPPKEDSPAAKVRESLRHPIYVHSKLMIVDDTHVILGSANINQRSLDGNRDSEICLHGFQKGCNMGGVHVFREALWSAHLGGFRPSLADPGTDECLAEVKRITENNWEVYTAPEPPTTQANVHLLPYPVSVAPGGGVKALEKPFDNFPDTKASVVGKKSGVLPVKLTT